MISSALVLLLWLIEIPILIDCFILNSEFMYISFSNKAIVHFNIFSIVFLSEMFFSTATNSSPQI